MTKATDNAKLLAAVATALTKEFNKRFPKSEFSTSKESFDGQPKKMHGSLSRLRTADGKVNQKAVSRITRRAVNALNTLKGNRRLRFYSTSGGKAAASAINVTTSPPARIALHRNEIGFVFNIKAYA